jgi:RNA recognition motif-containing protein
MDRRSRARNSAIHNNITKSSMGPFRNDSGNRGRRVVSSSQANVSKPVNRNSSSSFDNGGGNNLNRRLYVGNLKFEVSWQDLKDHMKKIGPVVRADLLTDASGRSKGCGLVEYASGRDARAAMQQLNNTELMGRPIFIREDRENGVMPPNRQQNNMGPSNSHHERNAPSNGPPTPKLGSRFLFVGNLSWDVSWQDLKDHMKSLGGLVAHADIMLDSTGRSLGGGLVEFATVQDANNVVLNLQDSELKGRRIFIREDRERDNGNADSGRGGHSGGSNNSGNRRLYVGNLDFKTKWFDLKDHFKTIGSVTRADVIMEDDGVRSKGFGIVEYESSSDADAAIAQLSGSTLNGRQIFVREDREDKRRY